MKPKIYIETSVSYYTNPPSRDIVTAGRQQITREWWEESSHHFELYISVLVIDEAGGGDAIEAEKQMEALKGIPILEI